MLETSIFVKITDFWDVRVCSLLDNPTASIFFLFCSVLKRWEVSTKLHFSHHSGNQKSILVTLKCVFITYK
jgi:hypothetical protein